MLPVQKCYEKSYPQRYDLFKHMSASEFFAVDFDSLVLAALNNANVAVDAVQCLHVAYNVESFLNNLQIRGAIFQIVVFKCNEWMWASNPQMALVRETVLAHLKAADVKFAEFANWWSTGKESFATYCTRTHPEFIILSDGEQMAPLQEGTDEIAKARMQLHTQAITTIQRQGMSIVFSSRIVFKDSSVVGFVWKNTKDITEDDVSKAVKMIKGFATARPTTETSPVAIASASQRAVIAASAVRDVVKDTNKDLAKLFLAHVGMLDTLTLEQRCFLLDKADSKAIAFFSEVCAAAVPYVASCEADRTVVDLFDGRLFLKVVEGVSAGTLPAMGSATMQSIQSMWKVVPALAAESTLPAASGAAVTVDAKDDITISEKTAWEESPLSTWFPKRKMIEELDRAYLPLDETEATRNRQNFFRRVHADASTLGEKPYSLTSMSTGNSKVTAKGAERNIMINNTVERVKQDIIKRKERAENLKKEFTLKPFKQAFDAVSDFIADCQNMARTYDDEVTRIHRATTSDKVKDTPPDILALAQSTALQYYEIIMDAYIFLLHESMGKWVAEVDVSTAAGRRPDPTIATKPFIIIHRAREVLEDNAQYIHADDIKKKTKRWLRDLRDTLSVLGLRDNVLVWEELWKSRGVVLPTSSLFIPEKPSLSVAMTSVRFQMTAMGERLDRPRANPDPRVPFRPDEWQRELLDIVDRRESVLVCTPTSAGKTFVSFYCIKEAVMETCDNPGLIVYVCPTKALLRQSLASVYAKFMNKKYDSTWNVYGVLEDYAFMLERCQALVTIPEGFETLLMSPRLEHQQLVRRIRYVIFDEIHSIDDLRTGCVWERLLTMIRAPFIALSATVGNPNELADWLQSVQDKAKLQFNARKEAGDKEALTMEEPRFVVNRLPRPGKKIHRWSDLQKYIFNPVRALPPHQGRTKVYNEKGEIDLEYHSDSLITMHPMSVLTLKKLQEEGFPQDLPFLPREMLEMYDAMSSNVRRKVMPEAYTRIKEELEPEKYFQRSNSPLVTQNLSREYEAALIAEYMSWVEESKANKDVRKVVQGVLEDLGAGKSFLLPRSSLKLYSAMSEAQEEDDALLDVLYPASFFRAQLEPSQDMIQLHQYLLAAYLVHWERCSLLDNSSSHADKVKAVLQYFDISSAESLPAPMGELVNQIRLDNLPHRSCKSETKRSSSIVDFPGLAADVMDVYRQMNAAFTEENGTLDGLLPTNYFARIQPDDNRVAQYKQLLVQEYLQWDSELQEKVRMPSSFDSVIADLKQNYVLAVFDGLEPCDEQFLRLPVVKTLVPSSKAPSFTSKMLFELLVTLNTRDMLPAIVFNFDISAVEDFAFNLCHHLEDLERTFRTGPEFQVMLDRIEDAKKQFAAMTKAKAAKTRNKSGGGDDEDGKRGKGDNRVDKDEFGDLEGMLQEIPTILPYFTFSRLGAGESAQKVQELISEYIGGDTSKYSEADRKFIRCIQRGIGVHHAGMSAKMMSLMEHLFRTHNIGVMMSTTTLALGIHSPCRTVIIAGDNAELTNVQFRQMAGRAGRRGVDFLGHVVMFGLPAKKITRLMTSKLQFLRGHTIVDPTASLQCRLQEQAVTLAVEEQKLQKRRKGTKQTTEATLDHIATAVRDDVERIHSTSFLWNAVKLPSTQHVAAQAEAWSKFTQDFLYKEGYFVTMDGSEEAELNAMASRSQSELLSRGLNSYMNVRMNGLNYTLMSLLRDGVLHKISTEFCQGDLKMVSADGSSPKDLEYNETMLTVLSAFLQIDDFGLPLEIHPSLGKTIDHEKKHSVILPALPEEVRRSVKAYATRVLAHYTEFASQVSDLLHTQNDAQIFSMLPFTKVVAAPVESKDTLTLNKTRKGVRARCPFVALCGKGDTFDSVEDFTSSLSPLMYVDAATIPAVDFVDLSRRDGRPMLLNACTYDFMRVGSQQIMGHPQRMHLRDLNGLTFDDSWMILSRVCFAVDNMVSLSQYLAPTSHHESGIYDREGNMLVCGNLNCPNVDAADREEYGARVIRGMVFKCAECHSATKAAEVKGEEPVPPMYLCQGCALDKSVLCRKTKDPKKQPHDFVAYVEDDFVVCMEHMARNWRTRRSEIHLRDDAFVLRSRRGWKTNFYIASVPKPEE
eukprot:PhM_4_TR14123/c0_g1_i1/m.91024/K20103/DDX60; ATP-dependent RNA helicase DDX60